MASVKAIHFEDRGGIPNNPRLPLLVYPGVLSGAQRSVEGCQSLFSEHGWTGNWVDGIYGYHHYHSTAHEVLGVVSGKARVQFGGPQGDILEVSAGDVVVLPAGVGHCNKGSSGDFRVVGGYAGGREWELNTGNADERPEVLENIQRVPLPGSDPVYGGSGPLLEIWEG